MTNIRFKRVGASALLAAALLSACGGGGSEPADTPADDGTSSLGAQVDAFMTPYLSANGITAATLTIMKDGVVLYEKAYGHKDAAGTTPLPADALLTGASIVKPVTAAAIQALAAAGSLALDDRVFCQGSTTPSAANHCWIDADWVASTDARIHDITIAHLLAHRAGWDRAGTGCHAYRLADAATQVKLASGGNPCDLLQQEPLIQAALGLSSPPTRADDIRFFMSADLDYTPGTAPAAGGDRYSNFGYLLLGWIVEQASGTDYNRYVNTTILGPLGVAASDFKTAQSLLADADPREPNYITSTTANSVFVPGTVVSARDGAINAANHLAEATTLMTSGAMARFAGAYRIDTDANGIDGVDNGLPLGGATHSGYHRGDLPGTAAVLSQRTSGVSYAVLMNKNDRYEGSGTRKDYPADVKAGLDGVLSSAGY